MANRPIFKPTDTGEIYVREQDIEFTWVKGMSFSQAQKRVVEFHHAIDQELNGPRVLEISTKSQEDFGSRLSAFNLNLHFGLEKAMTVETAFQSSKVFNNGGPFLDLRFGTSRAAKKDERLRISGDLIDFDFLGERWPLSPKSIFYDWLYLNALLENVELASNLLNYDVFTDIEFNPKKSFNCQARSAALYCSLVKRDLLDTALKSKGAFIKVVSTHYLKTESTPSLFDN
jgi:hypothetical protein